MLPEGSDKMQLKKKLQQIPVSVGLEMFLKLSKVLCGCTLPKVRHYFVKGD